MDFGNILSRAWQIAWKNKALWLFGILASCGRQSGFSGQGFNFSTNSAQFAPPGTLPPEMERFFYQLERGIESISPEAIVAFSLAVFAIAMIAALLLGFFSVYGRVSVIKGTLIAESGGSFNTASLAREGYRYFWPALGLNLMLFLALFIVMGTLIFVGVVFSTLTFGLGLLCFFPLICLLVPFSILYYVYIEMANVALVSEDLGVMDAARRGWEVMQGNWGEIVLMSFILIIGGALLTILISLPIVFVAAPFVFAMMANNSDLISSGFALSGLCFVIGLPIVILANGILRSFIEGAWTLTYLELAGKKS